MGYNSKSNVSTKGTAGNPIYSDSTYLYAKGMFWYGNGKRYYPMTEGQPVPVVYGKCKVPGVTIALGKVVGSLVSDTSKAALNNHKYTDSLKLNPTDMVYFIPTWQAICMGKVSLVDVYINDILCVDGRDYANTVFVPADGSQFNDGTGAIYPLLPSPFTNVDGIALLYPSKLPGVAHLNFNGYWYQIVSNSDSSLPEIKYVVQKDLGTTLVNTNIADATLGYIGNNPAAVIYDLLTNKQYGLGISTSRINTTAFNSAATFLLSKLYGINCIFDDCTEARSYIQQIFNWTDALLTIDSDFLYTIKVLDPNDAQSPLGVLSDDDYRMINVQRQCWRDVYNDFTASYIDADRSFEKRVVSLKNEAAIQLSGLVKTKEYDLTCFNNLNIASKRLTELAKRDSYPKITLSIETDLKWSHAMIGDVLYIINTEYGISAPFRIYSKTSDELDRPTIKFELQEMVEAKYDGYFAPQSFPIGQTPEYDGPWQKTFNSTDEQIQKTFTSTDPQVQKTFTL